MIRRIFAVIRIDDGRWMIRFDGSAMLRSYYEVSTYGDACPERFEICNSLKDALHRLEESRQADLDGLIPPEETW